MDLNTIRIRQWATPGDEVVPVPQDPPYTGHHPNSEAIGGHYGIQWWEVFKDRTTGELYRVHCYDGTYRSKGPYESDSKGPGYKSDEYDSPRVSIPEGLTHNPFRAAWEGDNE